MGFLKLNSKFKLIQYDNDSIIFNQDTEEEYKIGSELYDLVNKLDGSKTEEEIKKIYHDSAMADLLLKYLKKIGAIDELIYPIITTIHRKAIKPYIERVHWDITSSCNLQCTHCYVSDFYSGKKGIDLSKDEVFRSIEEMAAINVRDISLTGGEPLTRKDLLDIVKKISDEGIRLVALFTNGILITNKFINFLRQTGLKNIKIHMSMDGLTAASNSVIRKDRNSPNYKIFDSIIESIQSLVNAGFFVSITTEVHRLNVSELPEMYSLIKKLKVKQWRMAVPKPLGRFSTNMPNLFPKWQDVFSAYKKIVEMHLSDIKIKSGRVEAPIKLEIEQVFQTNLINRTLNNFTHDDIACFYHRHICVIKPNGDVIPCGYFDNIVGGNIKGAGGLKSAWENSLLQNIKTIRIKDVIECSDCDLIKFCGTGCRAIANKINGNVLSKDPYACEQAIFFNNVILPLLESHKFNFNASNGCSMFSLIKKGNSINSLKPGAA